MREFKVGDRVYTEYPEDGVYTVRAIVNGFAVITSEIHDEEPQVIHPNELTHVPSTTAETPFKVTPGALR